MNILYIRRIDDVFLKGYLQAMQGNSIFVLDQKNFCYSEYQDNSFKSILSFNFKAKNKYLSYLFRIFFGIYFLLKNKSNFDVIHILNIKRENFFLIPFLRKKCKKLFLIIYGRSTFANTLKKFLFKNYFSNFDNIFFSNSATLDEFNLIYKINPSKLVHLMPPLINLYYIDKYENNRNNNQYFYNGLKKEKIKILCSTTVASYDNHYKIIDSLKLIPNKNNIQLIFMLTYGGSGEERNKIIEYIHKKLKNFDILIIRDFVTFEQLAYIRKSLDIFINMRTSDQLAGAMLESLYAGAIGLIANWLDYKTLDNLNIKYESVTDFTELTEKLEMVIDNINYYKLHFSEYNKKILYENFNFEKSKELFLQKYIC